ncbi:MAG TPA: hypothetical protein VFC19_05140 [Candidatus Limnocylindrales bacterium]|nr:hypothetical protein [Candidatus Limnocylindrales bacterium]
MTEDLVGDTFRQQEHQVDGRHTELGQGVRRKLARRRAAKWWIAGGLTLATTLAGSAAGLTVSRDHQQTPPQARQPTTPPGTAAALWRVESSLGAQAEIPAGWGTNDFGCNMTAAPTVVRGQGSAHLCLTPEPPVKEVAIFGSGQLPQTPAGNATRVTINGVPAQRTSTTLDKGRYHGWIHVPSLDVYLVVRTLNQATTDHILDSFQISDPDHLGCPAVRPPVTPQQTPPGGGLVPPAANSVAVCRYAHTPKGRLEASATMATKEADSVVAALNQAPQGRNPDPPPDRCIETERPATDVVLLVTAGAKVTRVWIIFSYCTGRGMTNGVGQATVSDDLIHAVMRPLKVGYAVPNGPAK